MKLLNRYNTLLTVFLAMILSSCFTDDNPCPDVGIGVEVDSVNMTATITLDGLENLDYQVFVNEVLVDEANLDSINNESFSFNFEPGTYDVCIRAESDQCDRSLEVCQEIVILDPNREECLGLEFTVDQLDDHQYKFIADFEGIENILYTWYVDDDSVQTESLDSDRTHQLLLDLGVGEHTVCIVAETDDCGEVEYCQTIVVDQVCPTELFFEKEEDGHNTYFFFAEFENMDHVPYKWFINDDEVDRENYPDRDTDHKLFWQFNPGEYSICIVSDVDGCEAVEYCIELVVEVDCVEEVYFDYEQEADTVYVFYAEFEGKTSTPYKWLIDNEVVDVENFDNSDTDHKLIWGFDPGTYTVCLITDQDGCEVVEYCESVTVEKTECVDLSFTGDQEDGTNVFVFTADFEERDDVTYIWSIYINDDFQGDEVREAGSDDDHQFVWQFEPGVEYVVCLKQDGCQDTKLCQVYSIPD